MNRSFISFKTLCFSIGAVVIVETGIVLLTSGIDPYPGVLIGRICQTILMLLLLKFAPEGYRAVGLTKAHWKSGLVAGCIYSAWFAVVALAFGVIFSLAGITPLSLLPTSLPEGHKAAFFLAGTLFSPLAEELFFRGIVQGFFRPVGRAGTIILTTLFFTALHMNGSFFPFIPLIGGIVFSIAYERTQSLATPFVIHSLGNLALFCLASF